MDNILGIVKAVFRGFVDSLRGTVVLFYLDKNIQEKALKGSPLRNESLSKLRNESLSKKQIDCSQGKPAKVKCEGKVLKRALQCCLLNGGVFLLSLLVFEEGLLPLVKFSLSSLAPSASSWLTSAVQTFLSVTFSVLWVLPLFFLSKVVNSLWFQDIADSAYRYSRGRPQLLSSVGKLIADALFSVLVQFLFLIQSMLVSKFPVGGVGFLLSLVHMCMLYSLYAFEYKWYNMGWELHKRLSFIELNWPYFIGFGLPLAILTNLTSSYIISGCVFSILFPLFIISANEADPVTNICTSQLQLFSPVVAISNTIFNRTIGSKSIRQKR